MASLHVPFDKPKERYGPPRYSDAYKKIVSCFIENLRISNMSWKLLRLLSRQNIVFLFLFLLKALNKLFHFGPALIKKKKGYQRSNLNFCL